MIFENQVVVVTGAAGVLGHAVANAFADAGAQLICLDYTDELLSAAFPDQAGPHLYRAVDLTSRESCAEILAAVVAETGSIDVLANIAGGFAMGDPVHATSDQTWDFLFDLNARSVLNMASAVVPVMLAGDGGAIINVAAQAGNQGMALMGAYTASKASVMRLTESMAQELRDQGINVNAVMPSLIDTPRNRADMPDADFTQWVSPADLAAVVTFLASPSARAVHGACVPVVGLS